MDALKDLDETKQLSDKEEVSGPLVMTCPRQGRLNFVAPSRVSIDMLILCH